MVQYDETASGKSVKTAILTARLRSRSRVEEALGNVDHKGAGRRVALRHETQRNKSPRFEDEEIAGRIGFDRAHGTQGRPVGAEHEGADQFVDPELPGDLDGLGLELDPAQTLGL